MANPTCTVASILTNYPCFTVLNTKQQLAFIIWYMANELATIGGTNYIGDIDGTAGTSLLLNETSYLKTVQDGYVEFVPTPIQVAIAYNNALSAGASVTSAVNTTVLSCRHLCNPSGTPFPTMQRMYFALLCQLGRHKVYPQ